MWDTFLKSSICLWDLIWFGVGSLVLIIFFFLCPFFYMILKEEIHALPEQIGKKQTRVLVLDTNICIFTVKAAQQSRHPSLAEQQASDS